MVMLTTTTSQGVGQRNFPFIPQLTIFRPRKQWARKLRRRYRKYHGIEKHDKNQVEKINFAKVYYAPVPVGYNYPTNNRGYRWYI